MHKYLRSFAGIVCGLVLCSAVVMLYYGSVVGVLWVIDNWFWPTIGILGALWFFSAPFKRFDTLRYLFNLNPIAWILAALLAFMVIGSYQESVRRRQWCEVIESSLDDNLSRLARESGLSGKQRLELQTPQAIQYREWLSVQRAVEELCRDSYVGGGSE